MFIDTHCHLFERVDNQDVLKRAKQDNIIKMIDVAFNTASSFSCRDFSLNHSKVYFTAGIHPDSAEEGKCA
jgi:TatD DNase family protein